MPQKLKAPLFLTFEGGEGAGKTTLIARIKRYFEEKGAEVVSTREPGGTPLGEKLREIVLNGGKDLALPSKAELLIFLAARASHVEQLIRPALKQNKVVLCDRFNDSTVAYQGIARALGLQETESLCAFATDNLEPDMTFYLDLNPEEGFGRMKKAERTQDRMESETIDFHQKVRNGFLELAKRHPQRIKRLDASKSAEEVFEQALKHLESIDALQA
jgi:dTMP kinase